MSFQEDWKGGFLPIGVYPVCIIGHSFKRNDSSGTTWLSFEVQSANYETGKFDLAVTQRAQFRLIAFAKACKFTEEESAKIELRHWKKDFNPDSAKLYYGRWFIAIADKKDKYVNIEDFKALEGPPPVMGKGPEPVLTKTMQEDAPAPADEVDSLPF